MSKESQIKKHLKQMAKLNPEPATAEPARKRIISRPAGSLRRPVRRYSKRFIITVALWVAALIAAIFFLTQR
jgi:hypothetical protein